MGAYTELSKFFSKGIVNHAISMGYSEENILILNGDITNLKIHHPQIYSNLISCSHHRDKRTPIEYGQDLVASWLFEDSIVSSLGNQGVNISLAGNDCERKILSNTKVSSNSDCLIINNNLHFHLEIMSDYTGYWKKTGKLDLRDSKYIKLRNTKSLFLGVSTPTMEYILIDFGANVPATYIDVHPPYGGKPAYSISIKGLSFKRLNIKQLADEINSIIK